MSLSPTEPAVRKKLPDSRQPNHLDRFPCWYFQEIKGFIEK